MAKERRIKLLFKLSSKKRTIERFGSRQKRSRRYFSQCTKSNSSAVKFSFAASSFTTD